MKINSLAVLAAPGTRVVVYTPADETTRSALASLVAGEGCTARYPCWPGHRPGQSPLRLARERPASPRAAGSRLWLNLSGMAIEVSPPSADAGKPDPHTTAGKIADLDRRRQEAIHAGSQRAVERQHAKGKMTARERVNELLDPGSFSELDEHARHRATDFGVAANRPYGDGVVTGYGTIDGRPVCVFSQDFTVFGGSLGEVYGEKIVKVME